MEWKFYEENFREESKKTESWLEDEYFKLKTGKANPVLINNIPVNIYGSKMKILEIANVSNVDARQLIIKPYDKSSINDISEAIIKSNIGINPIIDKDVIRLIFLPPSEESRKESIKKAKNLLEQAKIGIRNIRKTIQHQIKKDDELFEDNIKQYESLLDKTTKEINSQLELIFQKKEKELTTI